jgi:hypothetical protein
MKEKQTGDLETGPSRITIDLLLALQDIALETKTFVDLKNKLKGAVEKVAQKNSIDFSAFRIDGISRNNGASSSKKPAQNASTTNQRKGPSV